MAEVNYTITFILNNFLKPSCSYFPHTIISEEVNEAKSTENIFPTDNEEKFELKPLLVDKRYYLKDLFNGSC